MGLIAATCGGGGRDGELISFVSDAGGDWEVYVMNADGSGVVKFTDNTALDAPASWVSVEK